MKKFFSTRASRAKQAFTRGEQIASGVAAGALVSAGSANAAIDVDSVTTALGAAETSAHSVATVVIGIVAGLVVVGIIISLVRKM